MIKAITLLILAGIVGVMAYLAFTGECVGGNVVRSEEHCLEKLPQGLCRAVFAQAKGVAQHSNSVYTDPVECAIQFGPCLPHATILSGYVPVPAGFCVKSSGSTLNEMIPVYRRISAR
ncbi:MAG: hypothetical protein ACKVON_06275 [Beijerinckiaceae bacterium]